MREYFVWLFKLITLVVIFVVFIPLLIGMVITISDGDLATSIVDNKNIVAVIEVDGIIDDSKKVLEELHRQVNNPKVQGIVLRVNSPGGAVGPSQDIYARVRQLKQKKPIVASMGTLAASGGLYVSLGASRILAQPGTITGSIGVILQIPNLSKITEKIGIDMVTIKSGQMKDVGNTFREMTEEERQFLESTVKTAHQDFVQAVVDGRGIARTKVEEFADGRIILGSQAVTLKLIDGYGDVYDAARAVFDVMGKPLKEGEYPELIYPGDKFKELRDILSMISDLPKRWSQQATLRYQMY